MNNSIKLYATHYDQDIPRSNTDKSLEKNVTRVLPMFKSDAKVVFERDLFQGSDFVQTLEPRVQYYIFRIKIKIISITLTLHCCSQTIAVYSVTEFTVALTVSPLQTSSPQVLQPACMMML